MIAKATLENQKNWKARMASISGLPPQIIKSG